MGVKMEIPEGYDSIMHVIAEKLVSHFEGTNAVNYIEQVFKDESNPSKCFVLTMQMKEGLTPCQKLATSELRVKELEGKLYEIKELLEKQ